MTNLADQIRAKLVHLDGSRRTDALLAVVETCLWMPTDFADGERIATNLLTVIARELGINPEETS